MNLFTLLFPSDFTNLDEALASNASSVVRQHFPDCSSSDLKSAFLQWLEGDGNKPAILDPVSLLDITFNTLDEQSCQFAITCCCVRKVEAEDQCTRLQGSPQKFPTSLLPADLRDELRQYSKASAIFN